MTYFIKFACLEIEWSKVNSLTISWIHDFVTFSVLCSFLLIFRRPYKIGSHFQNSYGETLFSGRVSRPKFYKTQLCSGRNILFASMQSTTHSWVVSVVIPPMPSLYLLFWIKFVYCQLMAFQMGHSNELILDVRSF